jgi:hypothetical protein
LAVTTILICVPPVERYNQICPLGEEPARPLTQF